MRLFRSFAYGLPVVLALLISTAPAFAQSSHLTLERFLSANEAYGNQDFGRAYLNWKLLAEVGHAKSQANLGLLYLCGKGVEKDVDRAVQWMERAATQGIVSAQFTLGFLYSTTKHGQLDPSRSIHWYLAAARQGHPQASLNLARAYEKGVRVKASSVEALRWLIAASKIDKSEKLQGKFVEFEQELRAKLSEESIAKAVELAECCSRGETVASGSAAKNPGRQSAGRRSELRWMSW